MQIRTILYQYIKTLIKHVFLLNFTHELYIIFIYIILYTHVLELSFQIRRSSIIFSQYTETNLWQIFSCRNQKTFCSCTGEVKCKQGNCTNNAQKHCSTIPQASPLK